MELNVQDTLRAEFIRRLREVEGDSAVIDYDGAPADDAAAITTLLEVRLTDVSLFGRPGINPPLKLSIGAQLRLLRGPVLVPELSSSVHGEDEHTLSTWAAGDATRFREELTRRLGQLANGLVDEWQSQSRR